MNAFWKGGKIFMSIFGGSFNPDVEKLENEADVKGLIKP
jgi:hypothetical protein